MSADRSSAPPRSCGTARPVAYYGWSGIEQQTNATQISRAISLAVRAHRELRRPGRQRAVPRGAHRERGRRRFPVGGAARPHARPARPAARPVALGARHLRRDLPRHPRAASVSRARAGRLRREPPPRPRRRASRARGAGRARLLRPRRPVHEPDGRAGRRRPAGRLPLRARGAQDRLRRERGGAVAGPAPATRWSSRAARPAPTPRSCSTSRAASASATTSGTATSTPPTATSSARPASRSRRSARPRAACGCRSRRATASTPRSEDGVPAGFATPTRKIELYSETFLEHGYPPLPDHEEPLVSPRVPAGPRRALPADPDLRQVHPVLREPAPRAAEPAPARPDPEVELHPSAAAERGIAAGDWVIETPGGTRAGAGAAEREPGAASRLRPARLVAGLPGARRARLRPVQRRTAPTSTSSSATRRSIP